MDSGIAHLIWGLVTILGAALLFGIALRAERLGAIRAAAIAIVVAGAILRLYAGSDRFLHEWDERYHAVVAKNLISHPLTPTLYDRPLFRYDYRDWRANHIWLHKPPVALWLMAGSMDLFGVTERAMRLPTVILSAAAIFLTFAIGSQLWGTRVGLLAAFFHAIHGYLLQLPGGRAPVDHVDSDLIVFVELGVWLAVMSTRTRHRGLFVAIGVVTGLAVLTKSVAGLLVLPVWLALMWGREPPRTIAAEMILMTLVCAAVALPWQVYVFRTFPREAQWEAAYLGRHVYEPVERLGGSVFFYVLNMPRYFGEIIYLPIAWFFVRVIRGPDTRTLAPVAVWVLIPYVIFSAATTKMNAYVMTAAPAVCLIEALFVLWWIDRRPSPGRWGGAVYWTVLVLLIGLPARYTIERLKMWPAQARGPVWARELRELPDRLGTGDAVLFNLDRPIEAMFYTPYPAYPQMPTATEAAALRHDGFRVIVLDHGDLAAGADRRPVPAGAEVVRVSQWPPAPRPSAPVVEAEPAEPSEP